MQSPDAKEKAADAGIEESGDSGPYESANEDADSIEEQRRRDKEVLNLARRITNQSHTTFNPGDMNPFQPEKDSELDPHSKNFKARSWAKSLLQLQSRDPEKYPQRTAGIAFRNLSAYGFGISTDYQKTVGNIWLEGWGFVRRLLGGGKRKIDILRNFDGIVEAGEMLVVLGPPGSGCTTFLKTISGETHGFVIDENSYLNYQGISAKQMHENFRGESIYTAEIDVHFPMLTVGDTLSFAARARAPQHIPGGVSRRQYAEHMRDVMMATFGILHTLDTPVGNDFIRGVSGGERKRVTIAEAALSQAPLQCWDNSTRGLDSANAIEFCKTLRMSTDILGATACVSIYQAPQSAYDFFDKAIVLYEGRQIFFGKTSEAKQFFVDMGFECPNRQTDADFLTSMTSSQERVIRPGFENLVPRTPDEFAQRWKDSANYKQLMKDLDEYDKKYTIGGEYLEKFIQSRTAQQAKVQRRKSPYTLSYLQQVSLCLWRGWQRLRADPSITFVQAFFNSIMAMVVASVFFNLQPNTNSFFQRGALLFFAILLNAFGSALEILVLYAQRPIVEKHSRYALYHPSAEAFASLLCNMPYVITNAILFNLVLYFMTHLRREPGAFFFFLLISFFTTMVMSMMFRTIASVSRSLEQALAPAALIILAIVIYTGFAIPTTYMHGWARWINYINPIAYSFEAIMVNEFHNRNFTCSNYVPTGPGYANVPADSRACATVGSKPGSDVVLGDDFLASSFQYYHAHKWRNFGIIIGFLLFFFGCYLWAAEVVSAKKSRGEVLIFPRTHFPKTLAKTTPNDLEAAPGRPVPIEKDLDKEAGNAIQKQTSIFHWSDVTYDIKVKGGERRLLDLIDGWVKPGTLTALMGESGAGKTTLLDVLATRKTTGVIGGEMLVDGRLRDASFQRKTGYVQQQDLHLQTATVREALNFSALLRQPAHISRTDKLAYVDEVISLLDMEEYAEAVVGVPGEGLNVEQRKRLTIGVELAAKPQLLLFLDEPTSGLDSQTSWAICDLMEKLTKNGQAILCTIHQPSAMLFQRFNRLLFLAKGGKPVYFGEIGKNSHVLTSYFERNGASPCPQEANPAEWMLEVIGAAPGSSTDIDWSQVWRDSPELQGVKGELEKMKEARPKEAAPAIDPNDKSSYREFAAPFYQQFWGVTVRVFQQYWRTPVYIYSKTALCLFSGLFIGFSFFNESNSQQGLQNQMFGIFMLMTIFSQLVQQIHPHFVTQRALYEARERPSKAYSWKAFLLANVLVEIPWQSLMAVILFFTWYYPIGLYKNAEPTHQVHLRGAQMFLFIWEFLVYASTFANMTIAGIETAEGGGNVGNLLFSVSLIFCGVLATPTALPGFWIFMYRVSPFTYFVSGMLSTAVANTNLVCASNELQHFNAPSGQTCQEYLREYLSNGVGYLTPESANTSFCELCPLSSTNQFLAQVNISYSESWRNFGILWAYICFNVMVAVFLYWAVRVPKKSSLKGKKKSKNE
ncbi:ABC drug exporter AbcA [Rhizodiscina lignyota]|uniref:ABC drug exporter AbcA n=1 Tax=Rhizodiscina lignyota TaxID=1504668 RepID=A0A9P4I6F5_9PEZI|nr:ABC drug exporter AbcA [Rhizodiscina lignyota]